MYGGFYFVRLILIKKSISKIVITSHSKFVIHESMTFNPSVRMTCFNGEATCVVFGIAICIAILHELHISITMISMLVFCAQYDVAC